MKIILMPSPTICSFMKNCLIIPILPIASEFVILIFPGKRIFQSDYLETASKNMSAKHKEGTINQIAAPYDALL